MLNFSWLAGLKSVALSGLQLVARIRQVPTGIKRRKKSVTAQVETLEDRSLLSAAALVQVVQQEDPMQHMYADIAAHNQVARARTRDPGNQSKVHTTVTPGANGSVQPNDVRTVAFIRTDVQKGKHQQTGVRYVGTNFVGNVSTATLYAQINGVWQAKQTIAVVSNSLEFTNFGVVGDKKHPINLKIDFQFAGSFNAAQVTGRVDLVQGRQVPMRNKPQFASFTGTNLPDSVWTTGGGVINPTTPAISLGSASVDQGSTVQVPVVLTSAPTSPVTVKVTSLNPNIAMIVGNDTFTFTAANWNQSQYVSVMGVVTNSTSSAAATLSATGTGVTSATSTITVNGKTIVVPPTPHLITTETGGNTQVGEANAQLSVVGYTDQVLYRLDAAITSNVTVTVMSNDTSHGTVTPTTLTFTPLNWMVDQAVTVSAVPDIDGVNNSFVLTATSSVGNSNVNVTVIDAGIPVIQGAEYDFAVIRIHVAPGLSIPGNLLHLQPIHLKDAEGGVIDVSMFKVAVDLDGNGSAGDPLSEYQNNATIAVGPAGSGSVVNIPGIDIGRAGLLVQFRSKQQGAATIRTVPDSIDFTDNNGTHYRSTITQDPNNQWYFDITVTGVV